MTATRSELFTGHGRFGNGVLVPRIAFTRSSTLMECAPAIASILLSGEMIMTTGTTRTPILESESISMAKCSVLVQIRSSTTFRADARLSSPVTARSFPVSTNDLDWSSSVLLCERAHNGVLLPKVRHGC